MIFLNILLEEDKMKGTNKSYIRTILFGLVFVQLFFGGLSKEGLANNCDYVIFIHEDLICNAVDDLIDYRENHGYNVCLDTVYDGDTFNDIKDMISDYYNPYSNAVQPVCILLIGDAAGFDTLWMVTNSDVGNYIPSYWETYPLPHWSDYMFAIDELYACIDDGEPAFMNGSLFPDIYIGRIPASDTYEVAVYINKLFDYEDNDSLQEWKDNVLLIAGDSLRDPPPPATSPPEEVNDESELIVNEIVPADWESKILYYSDATVAARQDSLANNINSGQLIVSALGTAANHFNLCWYVFRYSIGDVPPFDAQVHLENYSMYPAVLGASCEMSRIDSFNHSGYENFYENFLFADSAGTVCWIGATGPTRQMDDFAFTETFYHSIFDDGILDIGRLNYVTKLNSIKDRRAGLFTIKQFCVYGDPAMILSANPGFAPTFTSTSFELTDPRVLQNKIYISQNVTNPNSRIIPEQYATVTPYGQRTYKIAGTDNSSDSSKIFWELLNDTIPVNQDRRFLTFHMYVAESPGDLRRIYIDAIVDSSNWLHEYDVFDQYGHGARAKNVPSEPGSWKYYALDLSDLYGSNIVKLLVGYDDGGDTCTGNFKAYFDEIKFESTWGAMPVIAHSYHPYTLGLGKDDTLSALVYDWDVIHDFGDTIYYEWSSTLGTLIDENTRKPTYMAPDSIIGDEPIDTVICSVSDNGLNVNADTMYIYYGPDGGIIYDGHGGPLIWNEYANPYYMLGDVEVPTGCTLTLNGGALIKFGDGIELKVDGSLQAADNDAYTVLLTSLSNSGPGDWYGIRFKSGSIGTLEDCTIKNAEIGIKAEIESEVNLFQCSIKDISSYGMYITKAEALIDSCEFYGCDNYGIYVEKDPIDPGDSVKIVNCKIQTSEDSIPAGSQYCIYTTDIHKLRIENNLLRAYNQGGIKLYKSTALLKNNQIYNCVYYGINVVQNSDAMIDSCDLDTLDTGIYALSGSDPKVRWCQFQNLKIGVKDNCSLPNLGNMTMAFPSDTGYNDLENCSQYYIYHFPASIFHYWAEGNYFGSEGPDENKFVGNPDYIPWLTEDPYPKQDGEPEVPLVYKLNPNFPNPFNPNTTISFSLAEAGYTRITVYNILGQKVIILVDDYKPPGEYSITWNGRNDKGEPVSTGIYLYRIESGSFAETKKMTLIR